MAQGASGSLGLLCNYGHAIHAIENVAKIDEPDLTGI